MKRTLISRGHGFTLIEVLISLSIMAVITSLLYGTFRTTVKTTAAIDEEAETYRNARVIFHQLTQDLSMIYQKPQPQGGGLPSTFFGEEPRFGDLRLKGEDKIRLAEANVYPADILSFISFSYQPVRKGVPLSGRAEITYSLSEDLLIRDARFRESNTQNEVGEGVLGLDFHYFDGKNEKWVDEWLPDSAGQLPRAIEIELILRASSSASEGDTDRGDPSLYERRFKTTVEIPFSETV
jgi:general secretion pathway protein J